MSDAQQQGPAKCPTCGKPVDPAHRPFCSLRCADVDLQRWLAGRYAIPIVEEDEAPGGERDIIGEP